MTRTLSRTPLLAAAASFAAMLAVLVVVIGAGRDPVATGAARRLAATPDAPRPGATTDQRIAVLQATVRAHPTRADGYTLLAGAYRQKVRETGDADLLRHGRRARRPRAASRPARPGGAHRARRARGARATTSAAACATAAARRAAPAVDKPFGVLVDAQVELGRYARGRRARCSGWSTAKPNLAAYARVSYFRELHGDLRGAAAAMRLAVSAGGGTAENVAYVQALLGNLEFARGPLDAAAASPTARRSRSSRATPPPTPASRASRRPAATCAAAIRRYRGVVARLPLPRVRRRAGRDRAGRRPRRAARAATSRWSAPSSGCSRRTASTPTSTWRSSRPTTAAPARAVALARRAWAQAPSVRSADALGWALTRAGRPRDGPALGPPRAAPRLARPDVPLPRRHDRARGGRPRRGARLAATARSPTNPRFSPLYAPRAAPRAGGRSSDEAALAIAAAIALAAAPRRRPGAAAAHPLGNFSINHLDVVTIVARPRRRPLRPRPGRDPDLPASAAWRRRRRARPQARRGRARR